MLKNIIYILIASLTITLNSEGQENKLTPPNNQVLFIVGQDLGGIGGFNAPNNDGYVNSIDIIPAGFTAYTSIKNLEGLNTITNYGGGDMCAQYIIDDPSKQNTVIAIGLYLVGIIDEIKTGTYDDNILEFANWLKATKRPIYLRIGYEFNASWTNYNPENYKEAYRYLVDFLTNEQVDNVAYVWQSDGLGTQNHLMQWYPGDDYVDWLAYSHFHNKGEGILTIAREKNKPVMIAEATPMGKKLAIENGEIIWNEWYLPLFKHIDDNPEIQALCYINTDWDSKPMWEGQNWGDSRIPYNKYIKQKWIETISNAKYIHQKDDVFSKIGFIPTAVKENKTYTPSYNLSGKGLRLELNDDYLGDITVHIYTTDGQLVFSKTAYKTTPNFELNLKPNISTKNRVYLIKIYNQSNSYKAIKIISSQN